MWPFKKGELPPLQNLQAAKWAEKAIGSSRKDPNPEDLLAALMYSVTRFGKPETSETGLFELGCYSLSAIDLWIFQKKPSSRNMVSNVLICGFNVLYAQIFKMDFEEIGNILNQRLDGYGQIYRSSGMDMQKITKALTQIMLFSQKQTRPCPYDLEHGTLSLDAFDVFETEVAIQLWLKHFFPVILQAVEA